MSPKHVLGNGFVRLKHFKLHAVRQLQSIFGPSGTSDASAFSVIEVAYSTGKVTEGESREK